MPYKNKAEYNEKMRVYMNARYEIRKADAIAKLGGKCVRCGSSSDLDFDHIDPKQKSFTIGSKLVSVSESKLTAELAKCQLLCRPCHEEKTLDDLGFKRAKGEHGTISTCRYCSCELCKAAKSTYNKEYKRRKAAEAGLPYTPLQPPEHGSRVMYTYHKCRCDVCKEGNTIYHRKLRDSKRK